MSELDLLIIKDGRLCVKQATKKGYIEISDKTPVVCDLSYPNSNTRRGRVQGGGDILPTLTAESNGLYVIEMLKEEL